MPGDSFNGFNLYACSTQVLFKFIYNYTDMTFDSNQKAVPDPISFYLANSHIQLLFASSMPQNPLCNAIVFSIKLRNYLIVCFGCY